MRWIKVALAALAAMAVLLCGPPAVAGPPYHTDDPDPTDTGGIEAYAFSSGDWDRGYSGEAGIEANYGAAEDVQLSIGVPLEVMSNPFQVGRDNLELSAKWRFLKDPAHGWSVATFPAVSLPTAKGARGVEMLLPLWGGWRRGPLAVFGGGGWVFSTVPGARDHWVLGVAATRQFHAVNLGIEAGHEGASERGGHGLDSAGLGMTAALGGPFALVARAGPAREEVTGHVFVQTYFGIQGVWGPSN